MIGSNTLVLNKAEMIRAVEFYLDEVQFKEPVKITNITLENHLFHVVFQETVETEG